MYYENSKYKDMYNVCLQKYGDDLGKSIFEKGESYFKKFIDEANYRGSDTIKDHMKNNIFPVLAYYMALLDSGISQEEAYENTLEQTQRYAQINKENNKKFGKTPGAFFLFRMAVKKVMAKNFPVEGWETEWIRCDHHEVHFNLKRCVYYEVVSHYNHPELCTVFCKNDTTAFNGYLPKIRFERSGTIGMGNELCDFHFINNS